MTNRWNGPLSFEDILEASRKANDFFTYEVYGLLPQGSHARNTFYGESTPPTGMSPIENYPKDMIVDGTVSPIPKEIEA